MKEIYLGIALLVVTLILGGYFLPRDSTDSPESRSGMGLHIDHLTGCHYLSKPFRGFLHRIAKDGKTHFGCKQ